MTQTAATQLQRVLQLIPRIADGERHAVDEIARDLGVDRRELLRDLAALVGDRGEEPPGFVEGVTITWTDREVQAFTAHFRRPMRLTAPELRALELGVAILRRERAPEVWAVADRALAQLREAIARTESPDAHGTDVVHVEPDADGEQWVALLRAALAARTRVAITYHAASADAPRERVVCPYGLAMAEGSWYLVASCDDTADVRVFRLDRIVALSPTDERFVLPDDFSIDRAFAHGRPFDGNATTRMRVRYSPRIARWIAEREEVEPEPDGSVTVEHPVADEQWAIRHVLQYGPDAEVLEPASLRGRVAERLRGMRA